MGQHPSLPCKPAMLKPGVELQCLNQEASDCIVSYQHQHKSLTLYPIICLHGHAVTDGELAPTDESAAASSSTADSAAADSLADESAAASSLTEQSGGFSSLTAESAGSVTPVQQDVELLSRPPAGTPPGLVQGVEEEARDVLQLRAQVRCSYSCALSNGNQ